VIGFGAPNKAGSKAHGSPLGAEEIAGAREASAGTRNPFVVPSDILDAWRFGLRSSSDRKAWEKRLATPMCARA
jgi:transketolase